MHHDGGVRHFTPAPDAVVVQHGDDTMFEVSTFDPVQGRMVIERTVYRAGAVRRASYFVRLPTPPEWVVWLEAAGFGDVRSAPAAEARSSWTAGSWWWWPRPETEASCDGIRRHAVLYAPNSDPRNDALREESACTCRRPDVRARLVALRLESLGSAPDRARRPPHRPADCRRHELVERGTIRSSALG